MTGVSAGTGIELSVEGHTKQECPAQVEGVETHSLMGLARYSLGLLGKNAQAGNLPAWKEADGVRGL
jgi:hypothetical protein